MNPVNNLPHFDMDAYQSLGSFQVNQSQEPVAPTSSLPRSGNAFSMHGMREAQPPRTESPPRVVSTADRMDTRGRSNRLSKETVDFLAIIDRNKKIVSLMKAYGDGEDLNMLEQQFPGFNKLFSDSGRLRSRGTLFLNGLGFQDREYVQGQIKRRQQFKRPQQTDQQISSLPYAIFESYVAPSGQAGVSASRGQFATEQSQENRFNAPVQPGSYPGPALPPFFGGTSGGWYAPGRQSPEAPSHSRLDPPMRDAPASGHDLQWAVSNIDSNSFRIAICSLIEQREHIHNTADAESYASISKHCLQQLLHSEIRSNGTSRFQLTALGEEYVDQQFSPEDRNNLIAIIASR